MRFFTGTRYERIFFVVISLFCQLCSTEAGCFLWCTLRVCLRSFIHVKYIIFFFAKNPLKGCWHTAFNGTRVQLSAGATECIVLTGIKGESWLPFLGLRRKRDDVGTYLLRRAFLWVLRSTWESIDESSRTMSDKQRKDTQKEGEPLVL